MAQKKQMTQQEWDRLVPAMATYAHITTEIGYAVLVDGERQTDVAVRVGRTKQNVANAVKRIWELYQQVTTDDGENLELVSVWLPKPEADKVRMMAAKFSINGDKVKS